MNASALLLSVLVSASSPDLPPPYATPSVHNFSKVIGWPAGKTPVAPPGFSVSVYARDLVNPRNTYVGPNGDVFVAEANTEVKGIKRVAAAALGYTKAQRVDDSANRISILRDSNHDGVPELKQTFLDKQNQPFGMLVLNGYFYVANTDGLWRYPYKAGDTALTSKGEKILDLPAGGYNNHWTRNLIARPDGKKIFVTVGSGSNVAEHGLDNEKRRANVLEINPDGTGERIYASGLRNPVGLGWAPPLDSGRPVLWAAVNERDELGDDLVPDYITGVQEGGFYGWPYSYYGAHVDDRVKPRAPELVKRAIVPDVPMGAHTASLGLAFDTGTSFPAKYQGGAFVGQHGSWNRSTLSGYQVAFVPFVHGKPAGKPEPFLTGFIADPKAEEVYGRPVGVTFLADGSLLVADDVGNTVWRVSAAPAKP